MFGEKVLVLDGAMGTVLKKKNIDKKFFASTTSFEVLNITAEDIVKDVHRGYIEAGADIIETNTFDCSRFSLKGTEFEESVYKICKKGAEIAKEVAKNYENRVLVAGSVGPTSVSLTQNSTMEDEMRKSYREQIEGLVDGDIDILLIETVYDYRNLKIAIEVFKEIYRDKILNIPVIVSFTCSEKGKIYSGESIQDIIKEIDNENIVGYGLNCVGMTPFIEKISQITSKITVFYPNDTILNELKNNFENYIYNLLEKNRINIIGGCCGTECLYVDKIKKIVKTYNCNRVVK
ncbi:homocysteine S-methyltransferase family protein [Fusobacterium sp.]|uniref:homocysteine S-methyltransferase family protein n=1 Tax=Fusobacterium sp. TaxID=68766 RepID=UPI0025BC814E|nr:homocysteine S-methyltransferase family protein [Fusobacterium sp.]